jgi:hypothetical protein
MKSLLQEFAVTHGLKQEGGVIPGKQGHFFECDGQIWMKTLTKFQRITNDAEAIAAIDEIGPDSDWGSSE